MRVFGRTHDAPPSVFEELPKGDFALWGGGEYLEAGQPRLFYKDNFRPPAPHHSTLKKASILDISAWTLNSTPLDHEMAYVRQQTRERQQHRQRQRKERRRESIRRMSSHGQF